MNLAFLTPDEGVCATSPLHDAQAAAGARFEECDGWLVAGSFGDSTAEAAALRQTLAWADLSHLGKFELDLSDRSLERPEPGTAARAGTEWYCPVTRERALVLCEAARAAVVREELGNRALDMTTQLAALGIMGPLAREAIARFCALDLRPHLVPPGSFMPGSVARTPGYVLCEAPEQYLLLFGSALATYVYEVVADAGAHLGGSPVGAAALGRIGVGPEEAATRA